MQWLPCAEIPGLHFEPSTQYEPVQKKVLMGKLFAFFQRDLLKGSGLEWVPGAQVTSPAKVVPLLGRQQVVLPGARHDGVAPPLELAAVLSDKALYREKEDVVHLLVLDPGRPGQDVALELHWNGSLLARQTVALGVAGLAAFQLKDLPAGAFQLRWPGDPQPRCEFQVAAYQLVPLVARLLERTAEGKALRVRVRLESMGIPVEGDVNVAVLEDDYPVDNLRLPCREGLLEASITLRGSGQHRLNLQLCGDASLTATVPLLGTRAEERTATVLSGLGQEVKASLLPTVDATEVRGLYLQAGAVRNTPVQLERVDAARGRLTARVALGPTTVVVFDPSWTEGPADARNLHHPGLQDDTYKTAEALFRAGKWEESIGPLALGWRGLETPHPYWAYGLACAKAQLGHAEEALNWLEQAVRDGWWEWEHLACDPDLASLYGHPRFQRIAGRGRVVLEFPALAAGQVVEFEVPRPLGLVAVGCWHGEQAWEGWAALIPPPELEPKLVVPQVVRPGESVTLEVEGAEGAQVYLVLKDARLASTDTATTRLATRLKTCADGAARLLDEGRPNRTTLGALAGKAVRQRDPFATPYAGDPFGAARAGNAGNWPTVDPFGAAPAVDPFASAAPVSDPFGSSSRADAFGAAADPFGAPAAADPFGAAPAADPFGAPAAAAPEAAPTRITAASKTATAVLERPVETEVLYAGLLPNHRHTFTVGEEASDLTVEAFVLRGRDWRQLEGRLRVAADPWLSLEVPPYAHPGDSVRGRVRAGTFEGSVTVTVTRDGHAVGSWSGRQVEEGFPVEPGTYEARVNDTLRTRTVQAPGRFRNLTRTLTFLQPKESFTRDPNVRHVRLLPGLDRKLTALAEATTNYEHCCCEQTAGRLIGALSLYGTGNAEEKEHAESAVLAGLVRMTSMWLRGRGFKSYPHSSDWPDDYWGKKAAQHLWSVHLLRGMAMSSGLQRQVEEAWRMTEDVTKAYHLTLPPRQITTAQDAYWVARLSPQRQGEVISWLGANALQATNDPVGDRVAAAFTAATLLRTQTQVERALKLANGVTGALNAQGRLWSTYDSVAALVMMTELRQAGLVGENARVRVDGVELRVAQVPPDPEGVECLEGVAVVEVTRWQEEDWSGFDSTVAVAVELTSWTVRPGQQVELRVRLEEGYQAGDMVWICLPEALSRVVGGGQVKLFSVDFEARDELAIPLSVTGTSPGRQHFGVCVRNMYSEARAGNVGLLAVEVKT